MSVYTIVLENRSLAENDPMNLENFTACKIFIETKGRAAFIKYVWSILDLTE